MTVQQALLCVSLLIVVILAIGYYMLLELHIAKKKCEKSENLLDLQEELIKLQDEIIDAQRSMLKECGVSTKIDLDAEKKRQSLVVDNNVVAQQFKGWA